MTDDANRRAKLLPLPHVRSIGANFVRRDFVGALLGGVGGFGIGTHFTDRASAAETSASAARRETVAAPEKTVGKGAASVVVVDSIPHLCVTPPAQGVLYHVLSRQAGWAATARGPIGGGEFYWDEQATDSVDGGTVFAHRDESSGRFRRLIYDRSINPTWWGASADGTVDDTASIQDACDYLRRSGGGRLKIDGDLLCGGIIIDQGNVTVEGNSRSDSIVVKAGSLGIRVTKSGVNFRNLTIRSQDSGNSANHTSGILFSDQTRGSIGHLEICDVSVEGFGDRGIEIQNALDCYMRSCFFQKCGIGLKISSSGERENSFSTTTRLIACYAISCVIGIDAHKLYRSQINFIGEYNDIAIRVDSGELTLWGCYFENNHTAGVRSINALLSEIDNYSNHPVTDGVQRSWDVGVVAARERGYRKAQQCEFVAKSYGVLSPQGSDPRHLEAYGSDANIGLRYGMATVAMVWGADLLDPAKWASEHSGEFRGWDFDVDGYRIAGNEPRRVACGMRQTVSLDANKHYVVDVRLRCQEGPPIGTLWVGAEKVQPGVPFSAEGGPTIVKIVGEVSGRFETHILAITLSEVSEDPGQVAEASDRLSRRKGGRGPIFSDGPPQGTFGLAEWVFEKSPQQSGYAAYVRTDGGPTEWAGVPLGMKQAERHPDSEAVDLAKLREDFNALLAKLRDSGLLASGAS